MRDHQADAVAPFEDQRVELPVRAAATADALRRDALRVLDREVVEIVGYQEIDACGDREARTPASSISFIGRDLPPSGKR